MFNQAGNGGDVGSAGVKVLIIGAGPGAYVAVRRAAQSGAAVTLVEQDKVGGNGLHRGCTYSKDILQSHGKADPWMLSWSDKEEGK
jgi:pyruvate/2-oxoglutarate dehydrogenase complex dihydrolipoamide dehydrogenase (E3) component